MTKEERAEKARLAKEAKAQAEREAQEAQAQEDQTTDEEQDVTEEAVAPEAWKTSTGKWAYGPSTVINCCDCGKERRIKIQDAFQVIRCAECQKKAQNKKRAAKKKASNQAASLERRTAEAMELLKSLGHTVTEGKQD